MATISCLRTFVLVFVGFVAALQFFISRNASFSTPSNKSQHLQAFIVSQRFDSQPNRKSSHSKALQATSSLPNNGMSVIISVFQQPKCLQQMVRYFRLCPVVQEIRVNWFQDDAILQSIPEDYFSIDNSTIPVLFDLQPNNISYRFSPNRTPLASIATFHVDVDTLYSCRALQFAYDIWVHQYHASTQTVVGFHPRNLKNKGRHYQFAESYQMPFRYNTVFATKGAILHKDLLQIFFQPQYQEWRDIVDHHTTAEDMLMSFVLAAHNVSTIALCVEPEDTCSLVCAQGKQTALAIRTATIRPELLDQLFDSFNASLQTQMGSDSMVWFNDSTKAWRCYSAPSSRKSISVADRKCRWFCDNTPVCPMSPRRKDPVDEW